MQLTSVDDAAWASPWRSRQVGEKVLLGLGLVLTALVGPVWPTSALVALVSVVAILGPARIRPRVLVTVMAAPVAFTVLGVISVAVGVGAPAGDATWWSWGPFSLGRDGLLRAAAVAAHALAGSLAVMVLATTTPMVDLFGWARRWHVPDALVEVASLTYRMLFVLLATTLAIREAQLARLGDAERGLRGKRRQLRAAGDLTGSVLVRSWSRARRLEDGLAGRGYESALLTLPQRRQPSPALRVGTVTTLAGIWLFVVLGHLGHWPEMR